MSLKAVVDELLMDKEGGEINWSDCAKFRIVRLRIDKKIKKLPCDEED